MLLGMAGTIGIDFDIWSPAGTPPAPAIPAAMLLAVRGIAS